MVTSSRVFTCWAVTSSWGFCGGPLKDYILEVNGGDAGASARLWS